MSAVANTIAGPELKIIAMAGVTFNPIWRFFDDEAKQAPSDLNGSAFRMNVKNKAGDIILEFSTEEDGGFTIQNGNELAVHKSEVDMDVEPGCYRFTLIETTYSGDVLPDTYGEFQIKSNETPPEE